MNEYILQNLQNINIRKVLLSCQVYPCTAKPSTVNRPTHALLLQENGEKIITFNSENFVLKEKNIIFLPKGSDYSISEFPDSAGHAYAINFDSFDDIDLNPFMLKLKNFSAVYENFKKVIRLNAIKQPGYELKVKSILYNIFYILYQEFGAGYISGKTSRLINPALEYIHIEYINGTLNISHLAQICKMSQTYFRTVFKKVTGISPLAYINALKISHAKELLSSGMYSISKTAELSGFYNESYFSREFKKATGFSPSQYRNMGLRD